MLVPLWRKRRAVVEMTYYIEKFNWDIKITASKCPYGSPGGTCSKRSQKVAMACCYEDCPLKFQSGIWPKEGE